MSELDGICQDIALYLEFFIDGAMRSAGADGQAKSADAVVTYYQAMGICELLLDAEVDAFFHHLIRSAQTRKWILEKSRTPGYPALVVRAGNVRGLHAAIAASQWGLAREIAALSPQDVLGEVEYEDDFCYAHFLHRYVLAAPHAELSAIVARFDGALEGGASTRRDLCRALLARDAKACEEAFAALIEEQTETVARKKAESLEATEGLFYPMSSIYVEGLAWLALLDAAGVSMPGEHAYCPSLARRKRYAPFQVTTFPAVPL